MEKQTTIILNNLPKISLNKYYSGIHWAKRKQLKDTYALLIKSQTKQQFTKPCNITYHLYFKSNPLDISNCFGMIKMIEDCLFPDDSNKIVKSITAYSEKSDTDYVKITVTE